MAVPICGMCNTFQTKCTCNTICIPKCPTTCTTPIRGLTVNGFSSPTWLVNILWDCLTQEVVDDGCKQVHQIKFPCVSADADNSLVLGSDGNFFVQAPAMDIYVDNGSFDGTTNTLTLTDNDAATPDISIDLSGLVSDLVDNWDGTFTHTSWDGTVTTIDYSTTSLVLSGTDLILTDWAGSITTDLSSLLASNSTYSLVGTVLTITDSNWSTNVDLASLTVPNTGVVLNGTNLEVTDSAWTIVTDLSSLTVPNTALTLAGTVLTITDASGSLTQDLASIIPVHNPSTFSQDATTGIITHTDGTNPAVTANLISWDTNNLIVVGSDWGTFLDCAAIGTCPLISTDADNGIVQGTDGLLYSTIGNTSSFIELNNGDGTLTYTHNDGNGNTEDLTISDCPNQGLEIEWFHFNDGSVFTIPDTPTLQTATEDIYIVSYTITPGATIPTAACPGYSWKMDWFIQFGTFLEVPINSGRVQWYSNVNWAGTLPFSLEQSDNFSDGGVNRNTIITVPVRWYANPGSNTVTIVMQVVMPTGQAINNPWNIRTFDDVRGHGFFKMTK